MGILWSNRCDVCGVRHGVPYQRGAPIAAIFVTLAHREQGHSVFVDMVRDGEVVQVGAA